MTKVVLKNKNKLTGTGYLFEFTLLNAGWNELPKEKQYGMADDKLIVTFPHCLCDGEPVKIAMFHDEIEVAA